MAALSIGFVSCDAMGLAIEAAPELQQRVCSDCGRQFSSVHGFLYKDGDAYAVYHALLQTDHPSTVVDLALSVGSWDEDATGVDRTRVGVRVWPEEDELKIHINDPDESAWGDSATFGTMAARGEVVGTSLQQEALQATEFVIAHDPRVREHLDAAP
jgi:hypothetical protein